MRRVRVLFLGGTISMTSELGSSGAPGGGLVPQLDGADLLASLVLPEGVAVDPVDVAKVDSSALSVAECLDTLARADEAVRRGEADGVVVVQGTDTLEETSYLWDLLWPHPQPFVVTGAMRPPEVAGADGPANVLAALTVATSPEAVDLGALVVVGDEIHAARHVTKAHSGALSAFRSPGLGPLGHVLEGSAALAVRVPRREPLPAPVGDARVGLVRAALDDDPAAYRAVAEVSDGLVVEGFGAGQVRAGAADVLAEAARTMPVVLVSRTGAGPVSATTYGGPGSGTDLVARGLVHGGRLGGLRARVLLRLLLGGSATREQVAAAFARHGR